MDELTHQDERWCPIAIIMANGSTFVVGSETNSYARLLPSGGVLIAYYSEAKTLDDRTFATTAQLPDIPGLVNNFPNGRTHPLEELTVGLPQYAPYLDSLTVLKCDESSPYAGIALDNCVSTQSGPAAPKWPFESKPSQRTISCISTFPDDTDCMLNDAH